MCKHDGNLRRPLIESCRKIKIGHYTKHNDKVAYFLRENFIGGKKSDVKLANFPNLKDFIRSEMDRSQANAPQKKL